VRNESSSELLDSSTWLFANIMLAGGLADQTKLQLLAHFKQTVEVELKERKSVEKLIRIATALLAITRLENQLSLKVG
jgi:hypothetical protein